MENAQPRLEMMVDIETLGLKPGSVIPSIGAVVFDAEGFHADRFFARLNLEQQTACGLTIDVSTVKWWMGQSDAARADTFEGDGEPVYQALTKFADFVRYNMPATIWAKGPQFDIVQLECLYDAFGLKAPWSYRAIRDLRTVIDESGLPLDGAVPRQEDETHHGALSDAAYQVRELMAARLKLAIPQTGIMAL